MKAAVYRAIVVALLTTAVYQIVAFTEFVAFCDQHMAWRGTVEGRSPVIRDSGFGVARPGDAIFACETPHCFFGIACHEDLDCVCAPATLDAPQVGVMLSGRCVVDQLTPSLRDDYGACRYARCGDHLPH
jgi:hypothetical protein